GQSGENIDVNAHRAAWIGDAERSRRPLAGDKQRWYLDHQHAVPAPGLKLGNCRAAKSDDRRGKRTEVLAKNGHRIAHTKRAGRYGVDHRGTTRPARSQLVQLVLEILDLCQYLIHEVGRDQIARPYIAK